MDIDYRDDSSTENVKEFDYKYDEGFYLKELTEYIHNTYNQHYSRNKYQATEFILDSGHGTGFLIGNIMKYTQRYGKKGTRDEWRKDLLKVLHYAIIMLYQHDEESLDTVDYSDVVLDNCQWHNNVKLGPSKEDIDWDNQREIMYDAWSKQKGSE